ncbi:MAG TPA: hypothetical protein VND64_34860, partial [Pirellulales bacterium]|nr:hypothetical protein [Pirellulales bacterium]
AQGRQPAVQVSAEAWTWLQDWWKAARSEPRRPRMPSAGTRCPADRRRPPGAAATGWFDVGTESPQRDGLAATGY